MKPLVPWARLLETLARASVVGSATVAWMLVTLQAASPSGLAIDLAVLLVASGILGTLEIWRDQLVYWPGERDPRR